MNDLLLVSYKDICPNDDNHNMRSCFLYMGIFPEDCANEASRLINLWVAEGFVPHMENHTMEDTAVHYLEQLAQRSMIQVVKKEWDESFKE